MAERYLGIDYGDAYIGLALGSQGSIAVPYKVVSNTPAFMDLLSDLVVSEQVDKIIVGLPKPLKGGENERTVITHRFVEELRKRLHVTVELEDERMTSATAHRKGVTGRVDAVAAAEILQSYLDAHDGSDR